MAKALGASVIIPHVCNNQDLFEAGFAKAVAEEYPQVKTNYHLLGKKFLESHPGYVQFLTVEYEPEYSHSLIIANMIAQDGVRPNRHKTRLLNYAYLVKSMIEVKKYTLTKFNPENRIEIHCPKFGSGIAGGNWNFIEELTKDIWNNCRVVIYEK